jgi:hypothetical protein
MNSGFTTRSIAANARKRKKEPTGKWWAVIASQQVGNSLAVHPLLRRKGTGGPTLRRK